MTSMAVAIINFHASVYRRARLASNPARAPLQMLAVGNVSSDDCISMPIPRAAMAEPRTVTSDRILQLAS
jgi:hypothetical protein